MSDRNNNTIKLEPPSMGARLIQPGEHMEDNTPSNELVKREPDTPLACPVCLSWPKNPIKIDCGHVYCFLCAKSIVETSGRCALCRAEMDLDFDQRKHQILGQLSVPQSDSGHYWFYEGRNGWWLYDAETHEQLEKAFELEQPTVERVLAGNVYVIDIKNMRQFQKHEQSRCRKICRETLSEVRILGVCGLRGPHVDEAVKSMGCVEGITPRRAQIIR